MTALTYCRRHIVNLHAFVQCCCGACLLKLSYNACLDCDAQKNINALNEKIM